jgi:hypothetical protein
VRALESKILRAIAASNNKKEENGENYRTRSYSSNVLSAIRWGG